MRKYLFLEDNGDIKADASVLIEGDLTVDGTVDIELDDLADVTITAAEEKEALVKSADDWVNAPYDGDIDGGSFA